MTTQRTEFDALDANPVILYVKTDSDAREAFPVLANMLNPGLAIPQHDSIFLSYTGADLTQVDYTLATVTKATLTLAYTDGVLDSVVKS